MVLDEFRPLTVKAGDAQIADNQRIRVQGSKNMTLFPDFFQVEIYNMTDEDLASLTDSQIVSVYGEEGGLICTGKLDDMYTKQNGANITTTISVVDGQDFWRSKVVKTLAGNSSVKTAYQNIIQNAKIGAFTAEDKKIIRGQTYCGRLADCVSMLAKSVNGRAYITNGTVFVTTKGMSAEIVSLSDSDVILDQDTAEGALIVKTSVKGYPVGALVEIGNAKYRLVSQKFDADNFEGAWDTYLILINEALFELEGG